jgi:5-methylcytosine-specific restriction protein A
MAKTPYARTPTSESREARMRAAAPRILEKAGFKIEASRTVRGVQLIDATSAAGRITAWVKCAWAPGTHGTCAVQIDFPAPARRPTDMAGVQQLVEEKAGRVAALGATHLLMYAADDAVRKTLAAYLMPIAEVGLATKEAIEIAPKLVKNGHSPSLYIVAANAPRTELVEVVQRHSIDLLTYSQARHAARKDAIDDLDQVPDGADAPTKVPVFGFVFERDSAVRDFVLQRANGKCEYCGELGFLTTGGVRFLETHHVITLASQGPDTVKNVIALCANHHREAHYGAQRQTVECTMLQILAKLNGNP